MTQILLDRILSSLVRFDHWLEGYGEVSHDHQGYFAEGIGAWAKTLYYKKRFLGTLAVAPMIFGDTFLPSARQLFCHLRRFPIADAHYAMGFAYLSQITGDSRYYEKAVHFLNVLEDTRCPGFHHYGWGYPFDWVTRSGTVKTNTPLITTVPYVYEAFSAIYEIDKKKRWLEVMHSIAEHALCDYKDCEVAPGTFSCAYTPNKDDKCGVVNASAYRAVLLMSAAQQFSDDTYRRVAEGNLNFVLQSQKSDGSWFYGVGCGKDFVDHFHTCFVLKAVARIEELTGKHECSQAIEKGVAYYVRELFDDRGLPKPFSRAPRFFRQYRKTLYDYAECINLGSLLRDRFEALDLRVCSVLNDLLNRWQKRDGSFYGRELLLGWDKIPMHRYAQSQTFRSLAYLMVKNNSKGHLKSEIRK